MEEKRSSPAFWKIFWRLARGALTIYVAVVVLVYFFQRKLQYIPSSEAVPPPAGERYKGLQEVQLQAADGTRLFAWHWPGAHPFTLVLFHGNAGHRGHRLEWIEDLHNLGLGVFLLDYRGYGGSEGAPTEEGLYRDGEAVYQWLARQPTGRLIYFGESLGCGVAVDLASRHPPEALILQSGFPSALEVARRVYFYLPVRWLMKDCFELREKLSKISCRTLVLHGDRDEIIPFAMGQSLFEALECPEKEFYAVRGAGHNDVPWAGGREYYEKIKSFVWK